MHLLVEARNRGQVGVPAALLSLLRLQLALLLNQPRALAFDSLYGLLYVLLLQIRPQQGNHVGKLN